MKVRPSVKKMCDRCKIIRRRGVVRSTSSVRVSGDRGVELWRE